VPIKLGLLPPYRFGVTTDPAWMGAFAQHADQVGFESLLTVEHVVVPVGYESRYPYSETGRMPLPEDCELPDPLDLLAWLAARTARIRLGTGILVLPAHHPLPLAKRGATIDRLSGGRLFLGVGVGWMREEVAALGIDPDARGSRTDEAIDALRVIWQEEEPTFTGQHFAFGPVRSHPKPAQATIPILVGGHSRAAARRAGERGDGFFPLGLSGDALDERWAQVREFAEAAGRDPGAIGLTTGGLLGDDEAITTAIEAGAERVVLSTRSADLDELRTLMDAAVARAASL
jgi:probable F420-dependent oxidoreductase